MFKSKTVVITSRHKLGIEGAKQAIEQRFHVLKDSYVDKIGEAELTWEGAVGHAWAKALGQIAKGQIDVAETEIKISVELPWLLAGMAGTLQSVLDKQGDALAPK